MVNQERGRRERGVDEDRDAKKRPVGPHLLTHTWKQGGEPHALWRARRKDCRDTSVCAKRVGLRRVSASDRRPIVLAEAIGTWPHLCRREARIDPQGIRGRAASRQLRACM